MSRWMRQALIGLGLMLLATSHHIKGESWPDRVMRGHINSLGVMLVVLNVEVKRHVR